MGIKLNKILISVLLSCFAVPSMADCIIDAAGVKICTDARSKSWTFNSDALQKFYHSAIRHNTHTLPPPPREWWEFMEFYIIPMSGRYVTSSPKVNLFSTFTYSTGSIRHCAFSPVDNSMGLSIDELNNKEILLLCDYVVYDGKQPPPRLINEVNITVVDVD